MKSLTICADDFGMAADVDSACLQLVELARLQALTCLVSSPRWDKAWRTLSSIPPTVELGLHFSIDKKWPFSPQRIEQQISQQWQIFTQTLGRMPDFMDGHLYVHQYPCIRLPFLNFAQSVKYVRSTGDFLRQAPGGNLKEKLIKIWGQTFYDMAQAKSIKTNDEFLGLYSFRTQTQYHSFFAQEMGRIKHKAIFVCHPGKSESWRKQEWEFLSGPSFVENLDGILLGPFVDGPPAFG